MLNKKLIKKISVAVLSLTMLMTNVPATVFAETVGPTSESVPVQQEEIVIEENGSTEDAENVTVVEIPAETQDNEAEPAETAEEPAQTEIPDKPAVDLYPSQHSLSEVKDLDFLSKRIFVESDGEDIVDENTILSEYEGLYLLQFEDEETAKRAYLYYSDISEFVDVDTPVTAAEGSADFSSLTYTKEDNPFETLNELQGEDKIKQYDVAILDTGISSIMDADSVSFIGDSAEDDNGHGTMMFMSVKDQNPDAKVLAIKVLDASGKGNISAVYSAMEYAISLDIPVINLSMYAKASQENSVLEQLVDKAEAAGITVVGSAGNDGRNVKFYVPGKIDEFMIVGAADENGTRIASSNYGDTVDCYVTAESTSEAAAKVSGWISKNGLESITVDGNRFFALGTEQAEEPQDPNNKETENGQTEGPAVNPEDPQAPSDSDDPYYGKVDENGVYHLTAEDRQAIIENACGDDFMAAATTVTLSNFSPELRWYLNQIPSQYRDTSVASYYSTVKKLTINSSVTGYAICGETVLDALPNGVYNKMELKDPILKSIMYYGWYPSGKISPDMPTGLNTSGSPIYGESAATQFWVTHMALSKRILELYPGDANVTGGLGIPASKYWHGLNSTGKALVDSYYTWCANHASNNGLYYNGTKQFHIFLFTNPSNNKYQIYVGGAWETVDWGYLTIKKASSNPTATQDSTAGENPTYNFSGIEFDVYSNSACTQPVTTDYWGNSFILRLVHAGNSGTICLPAGTYYIRERQSSVAGTGYAWNSTVYTVVLNSSNGNSATQPVVLNVTNTPANFGYLQVLKSSADPSTTNGNSNYSFEGIKFDVFLDHNCKTQVLEDGDGNALLLELAADGTSNTLKLPVGTYYIRENRASVNGSGYKWNRTVFTVNVTASNTSSQPVHISVTNTPGGFNPYAFLTIEKSILFHPPYSGTYAPGSPIANGPTDHPGYITGDWTQSDMENGVVMDLDDLGPEYTLTGIQFKVYTNQECTTEAAALPLYPVPIAGRGYPFTLELAQNTTTGTYRTVVISENTSVNGKDAVALPIGTYYIKEVEASVAGTGFEYNDTVYPITLSGYEGGNYDEPVVVEISNEPETGFLQIIKESSDSTSLSNEAYSLEGIQFKVYTDSTCLSEATLIDGSPFVLTVTEDTDNPGVFKTEMVQLPLGTYYIKEVPESVQGTGYEYNPTVIQVTVTPATVTQNSKTNIAHVTRFSFTVTDETTATVQNTPKPAYIQARKLSFCPDITEDNSHYSLADIQFKVYTDMECTTEARDINGNTFTLTSDETGYTNMVAIQPGTYYVKEVQASVVGTGYMYNPDAVMVVVTGENNAIQTIHHDAGETTVTHYYCKYCDYDYGTSVPTGEEYTRHCDANKSDGLHPTVTIPSSSGAYYKHGTSRPSWRCAYCGYVYSTSGRQFTLTGIAYYDHVHSSADPSSHTYDVPLILDTDYYTGVLQSPAWDEEVVGPGNAAIAEITNTPNSDPIHILLEKRDAKTGNNVPTGNHTLQGAQYTVWYYPNYDAQGTATRTWIFETEANGQIHFNTSTALAGSDEFFLDQNGIRVIPAGSIKIKETQAPAGYALDSTEYVVNFTMQADGTVVADNGNWSTTNQAYDLGIVSSESNNVSGRGIITKKDADTNNTHHGGASVAGIRFALVNSSTGPVTYWGNSYDPGEVMEVLTMTASGTAPITKPQLLTQTALPFGTYTVYELRADATIAAGDDYENSQALGSSIYANSNGYLYNDSSVEISITTNGQTATFAFEDDIVRGGAAFQKIDSETGQASAQSGASLQGAQITIYNGNTNPVVVNGTTYQPDAAIMTLTTDANGRCSTANNLLPYGTYTARETAASPGYIINSSWNPTFTVSANQTIVNVPNLPESMVRADMQFTKVDQNNQPMANIPFRVIRMDANGNELESHVIVSDANGVVSTANRSKTDSKVNSLDSYANGRLFTDESKLDPTVNIWFGDQSEKSQSRGSLVLGYYRVEELQCNANKGMALVKFDLVPTSTNLATGFTDGNVFSPEQNPVTNLPIIFATSLTDTASQSKVITIGNSVSVTDTIAYQNLNTYDTYRVETIIVYEDINGQTTTLGSQSSTLTPASANGTIIMNVTVNTNNKNGGKLCAIDRLYLVDGQQEVLLYTHNENLADTDQSMEFPYVPVITGFDIKPELPVITFVLAILAIALRKKYAKTTK